MVHLLQSRIDEAILWYEKVRIADPVRPQVHAHLASTYALKGDTDRAATELAKSRRLSGDDRYSSTARLKAISAAGFGGSLGDEIADVLASAYLAAAFGAAVASF